MFTAIESDCSAIEDKISPMQRKQEWPLRPEKSCFEVLSRLHRGICFLLIPQHWGEPHQNAIPCGIWRNPYFRQGEF